MRAKVDAKAFVQALERVSNLIRKSVAPVLGGFIEAGQVSADDIRMDDLESAGVVCRRLIAKRVETSELFAFETAAVSCLLSADFVKAGWLFVGLSDINEVRADEVVSLKQKKRSLFRFLLAALREVGVQFSEGVTTNLLGPCCSCGKALRQIAQGNNCFTYSVELDNTRADEAQTRLYRVGSTARSAPTPFICCSSTRPICPCSTRAAAGRGMKSGSSSRAWAHGSGVTRSHATPAGWSGSPPIPSPSHLLAS